MENLSDILSTYRVPEKKKGVTERNSLIAELYAVYALENKYENFYRYRFWLKVTKKQRSPETVAEFKKVMLPIDKKYIKPFTAKYFAIRLAHIPTQDLYFLVSMKNDIKNRQGIKKSPFTKYLNHALKPQ